MYHTAEVRVPFPRSFADIDVTSRVFQYPEFGKPITTDMPYAHHHSFQIPINRFACFCYLCRAGRGSVTLTIIADTRTLELVRNNIMLTLDRVGFEPGPFE